MPLFHETLWWNALMASSVSLWAALLLVDMQRQRYVPRTRRRYVAATAAWTLVPLAATEPLLVLVEATSKTSPFGWAGAAFLGYYWLWLVRRLAASGDDNWYRRTGRRLRRQARAWRASLGLGGLAPGGA